MAGPCPFVVDCDEFTRWCVDLTVLLGAFAFERLSTDVLRAAESFTVRDLTSACES